MLRNIRIKPNYLIPFTSTTIVMVILGLMGSAFIFSGELIKWLKENSDIAVELKVDASQADVERVKEFIAGDERVLTESIRHLPPEEAVYLLGLDYETSAWWAEDDLPFQDMVVFNLKAEFFDPAELSELRRIMKNRVEEIAEIHYQDRLVLDFHSNLEYFAWWFTALGLLFLMLSVILIYNTTKLALYADRREIETMELVGASRGFIRKPYLKKSFFLGFVSGLIAISLIIGLLYYALANPMDLITEERQLTAIGLVAGLPIAGGVFCLFCTWITLNQYLRSEQIE